MMDTNFHKEGDDNIVILDLFQSNIRGEIKLYHELVMNLIITETKDDSCKKFFK